MQVAEDREDMNMKRRVVAMMLAVVVVAGMVTGCGSSKNTSTMVETACTDYAPEYPVYEEDWEEPAEEAYDYSAEAGSNAASAVAEDSVAGTASAETVNSAASTEASKSMASADEYELADEECCIDVDPDYWYSEPQEQKERKAFENAPVQVAVNPLSTFAADVDTASYANLRNMIYSGYSLHNIPAQSIRTEEIVNYFRYDYAEPDRRDVFGVHAEVSECPWNKENLLMTVGINTAEMDSKEIPDCNIVFLVDVSGSMEGENRLGLIKKSMAMLVDNFDEDDRISIVTYASGVNTVLNGCKGHESRKIIKAFEHLSAGGSTYGEGGIVEAYKVAEKNYIDGGVNRIIICSDGDFNVGASSERELEDLISQKKESGIFLSTLGFGMGNYSDGTMETLADKGNGNYAYIDDLTEAKRVLVDEMTSTFVTVAKDVKLQVEFNPAVVSEYRLVGYENRALAAKDFRDDTKDGGELGAGHQVTAVYEIKLASEEDINLKYQDKKLSNTGIRADEYCTVSVAYKEPEGQKSRYLEYPIGTECYTRKPSDDYMLATAATLASLGIKDSEYLVDMDSYEALEYAIRIAEKANRRKADEYVEEFVDMLEILVK